MNKTTRHGVWKALLAAAVALVLGLPSSAFAATPRVSSYLVRSVIQQSGSRGLVARVQLPISVKLPATVRVPVPKDVTIDWAGEILGGDPSADPKVTYSKESGTKDDVLVFSVSKSRVAQVEMTPPQGASTVSIDLVAPMPADAVILAIEVESQAAVSGTSKGLQRGASDTTGIDLYQRTLTGVKAGQALQASLTYTGGVAAPGAGTQGTGTQGTPSTPGSTAQGPSPIPPPQALLVLVGIIAATFIALKRVEMGSGTKPAAATHESPQAPARTTRRRTDQPSEPDKGAPAPAGKRTSARGASAPPAKARSNGKHDTSVQRTTEATE